MNFVTLFVVASYPEKFQNRTIKFTLGNHNCSNLLKWSQLQSGDHVTIKRTQNPGIPRNRKYIMEEVTSTIIDDDNIVEI